MEQQVRSLCLRDHRPTECGDLIWFELILKLHFQHSDFFHRSIQLTQRFKPVVQISCTPHPNQIQSDWNFEWTSIKNLRNVNRNKILTLEFSQLETNKAIVKWSLHSSGPQVVAVKPQAFAYQCDKNWTSKPASLPLTMLRLGHIPIRKKRNSVIMLKHPLSDVKSTFLLGPKQSHGWKIPLVSNITQYCSGPAILILGQHSQSGLLN